MLPRAEEALRQVWGALSKWREFATNAGVPEYVTPRIRDTRAPVTWITLQLGLHQYCTDRAIHWEQNTVHEIRFIRGQEHSGTGNVLSGSETAGGYRFAKFLVDVFPQRVKPAP